MSRTQSLINILEGCEKPEFDRIVKRYLKEVYNYQRVVITDGKDDTGIDIKVFELSGNTVQYQLTVQRSNTQQEKKQLEYKILEDLKKAKDNAFNYGYSSTLIFFYSKTLTNKVIRQYKNTALINYGINLEIIEANQIAEESEEFIELQKAIYDTSGLPDFKLKESLFDNEEKNIVFDLIGFGRPADIRLQIVEAYILQLLYTTTELTINSIIENCLKKFNSKENVVFYEKLLARLQTSKKVTKNLNGHYVLTTDEGNRIAGLITQTELDENNFVASVIGILSKYNQEENVEAYLKHLKRIYVDNFNSDIVGVINGSASDDLSGISREFINYISRVLDAEYSPKELALELFKFCNKNKYIQKICAGKVFSERTNLTRLETYANTKKRIFIDTPLALHALCYFYSKKCNYDNYFYKTTYSFIEFCRKQKITVFIPEFYCWEAQSHVRDALNLIPFTTLPSFTKLGKSRNVLYNFYLFVKDNSEDDVLSYESFLKKFGFRVSDSYKTHNQLIDKYLSDLGIVKYHLEYEYNIEDSTRLIQNQLNDDEKSKTKFGLNNDGIMLEFLGHNDVDVHPLRPVFVTWDKTFFKVQSKYFEKNPNSQRWHLFTPSKFIDHYSLLNFSIDSETVTQDIIALLSDEIISNTHSLLDSLIFLLNPNDEVGLEFTQKLANIRDEEIYKVRESQIIPPEDFEGEAVIDDVFYQLTNHYKESEDNTSLFKKIFTRKEYVDSVINIIVEAVDSYYKKQQFNDSLITNFDKLIHEMVEEEQKRIARGHSQ